MTMQKLLSYMRSLPARDLAERRRFVVLATVVSGGVILLIYLLFLFIGGRNAEQPTPVPTETLQDLEAAPLADEAAPTVDPGVFLQEELLAPTPAATTPLTF